MKFIGKNKQAIEQLADSNLTVEAKGKIILKPGESGFLWWRYDSKFTTLGRRKDQTKV
jgi:hypothetical protein